MCVSLSLASCRLDIIMACTGKFIFPHNSCIFSGWYYNTCYHYFLWAKWPDGCRWCYLLDHLIIDLKLLPFQHMNVHSNVHDSWWESSLMSSSRPQHISPSYTAYRLSYHNFSQARQSILFYFESNPLTSTCKADAKPPNLVSNHIHLPNSR